MAVTDYCTHYSSSLLPGYKMHNNDSKPSNAVILSRHCVSVNNSSGYTPSMAPRFNNRLKQNTCVLCIHAYINGFIGKLK